MKTSRLAAIVLAACTSLALVAAAQGPIVTPGCYRFDQPYFVAIGRFPDGPVYHARTAVLRLFIDSTQNLDAIPRAHAMNPVEPVPFAVDSSTHRRYLAYSGWKMIGRDSVRIDWRNGLSGPAFRMAVRGDSLSGTFVETTDVIWVPAAPPPPPQTARAERISCTG